MKLDEEEQVDIKSDNQNEDETIRYDDSMEDPSSDNDNDTFRKENKNVITKQFCKFMGKNEQIPIEGKDNDNETEDEIQMDY